MFGLSGWCGLGARVFPRFASDREDVFALALVFAKLTNQYCNSRSVFPDDPRESSVLLTDQQKLYKALGVTGAGKEIIEDMLKLIPEVRPSIQEAYKRYQRLTATKLDEKLAQSEKDREKSEKINTFLQDQVIDNLNEVERNLEKQQRAAADNSANILKEVKKSF